MENVNWLVEMIGGSMRWTTEEKTPEEAAWLASLGRKVVAPLTERGAEVLRKLLPQAEVEEGGVMLPLRAYGDGAWSSSNKQGWLAWLVATTQDRVEKAEAVVAAHQPPQSPEETRAQGEERADLLMAQREAQEAYQAFLAMSRSSGGYLEGFHSRA